jgi:hypothetical protein
MDIIERWFGIAPDGGSGALEMLLVELVIGLAIAMLWWRARRRPPLRFAAWRVRLARSAERWNRGAELRDAE